MVKYIAWGRDVPTVPSPEASPAENAAQIENAALLRQCIARLSEKHRQIIHLRFYEDASLGDMAQRTALTQTKVHQAIIACALERYRLAHHAFPENLNSLAPQYLGEIPNDVVGGRPPRYRRDADGAYALYSIGWNEMSAGGTPAKSIAEGDWVWPEPSL